MIHESCMTREEQQKLDAEALKLAADQLSPPLVDAMDAMKDANGDDPAASLVLFTHTVAELVGVIAGTALVTLGLTSKSTVPKAYDSFIGIALTQIGDALKDRRARNISALQSGAEDA